METYEKKEVAEQIKIPMSVFTEMKTETGQVMNDFVNETLTVQLQAFIYEQTIDERELIYEFNRPTFLDWLLRRKRKAIFHFKAADLLLNPPQEKNLRTYQIIITQPSTSR